MNCDSCTKKITKTFFKVFDEFFCDNDSCLNKKYSTKEYNNLYFKWNNQNYKNYDSDAVYWSSVE